MPRSRRRFDHAVLRPDDRETHRLGRGSYARTGADACCLDRLSIVGVANNVDFLSRLVANDSFARGDVHTGLIEQERERLFPNPDGDAPDSPATLAMLAFACARVLADEAFGAAADPWGSAHGWRLNTTYRRTITLNSAASVHDVVIEYARDGYVFHYGATSTALAFTSGVGSAMSMCFGEHTLTADVVRAGDELHVFHNGRHRVLALADIIAQSAAAEVETGRLTAPMPGKLIAIHAARGARVERGTPLLVMEAMKMEHTIVAPSDGVVSEFLYAVGDQVAEGAELVRFAATPSG